MDDQQLGRARLYEGLKGGENVGDVFHELGLRGINYFAGALWLAVESLENFRRAGYRFSSETPAYREILTAPPMRAVLMLQGAMNPLDEGKLRTYCHAFVGALEAIRHSIDFTRSGAEATKPEPLEIKIVGLPDRLTTSDVVRDQAGNITKTVQHEFDKPAEASA